MRALLFLCVALVCLFCTCHAAERVVSEAKGKSAVAAPQRDNALHPFQLVRPTDNHQGLELVQEGLDYLRSIRKPLAIVGVVGPYHSGKSFLLNTLISMWRAELVRARTKKTKTFRDDNIQLFEVAEKVSPTTMGLWLLKTDIELPDGSVVLFMDTEGFYGKDVSESYDARVFTLATLLSSHLVYNSIKLVDQSAVEYLELLARRTQVFQIKNIIRTAGDQQVQGLDTVSDMVEHARTEQKQHVLQYNDFPPLSWVVKDFAQHLEGMTPNQWLDQYIDGHRDQTAKTRQNTLRDVFRRGIDCHTMFLPSTKIDELSQLGHIDPNEQLTGEFVADLRKLQQSIATDLQVKRIDNQQLDGAGLAALAQFIMRYINEDNYPKVPSLWNHWVDDLTEQSHRDIQQFYDERIRSALTNDPPLNTTELKQHHYTTASKAIEFYREMLFGVEKLYAPGMDTLKKMIESRYAQFEQQNMKRIERHIQDEVQRFRSQIDGVSAGIVIPQNPESLQQMRSDALLSWVTRFSHDFSKYEDSSVYTDQKQYLEEFIDEVHKRVETANDEFIGTVLNTALTKCSEKYSLSMQNALGDRARATKHLQEADKGAASMCQHEINSYLSKAVESEEAMQWVRTTLQYARFQKQVETAKHSIFDELLKKNNQLVRTLAHQRVNRLLNEAQVRCEAIDPFPDQEDILKKKLGDIVQHYQNEYTHTMSKFSDSAAYEEQLIELESRLMQLSEHTGDRNVKAVILYSDNAFQCAKAVLDKERCTFCLSNFITFMYDRSASYVAERCFERDKQARKFSEALRYKAIQKWLQQDMAEHRNAILFNMMMLLVTVICLLLGCLYISSTLSPPKPFQPHMVQGHGRGGGGGVQQPRRNGAVPQSYIRRR